MMLSFVEIIFCFVVITLSVPVITLFAQIVLSLLPYTGKPHKAKDQPSVVILIPAHNESTSISPTLLSINGQLWSNAEVLVVADNCNDDTAEVARSYGVEVIERFNDTKRGKGYALDFGIQHLSSNPPEVVVILDADCLLGKDTISILVNDALHYQCPIQGLYLMYTTPEAPLKIRIAEFAWTVKNRARPLGFHRLGLPCQLMGSGMSFPWEALRQVDLASGHIAEDMKLGVDLARLNLAPRFCPNALITSRFPANDEGIKTQRTRWEHGHIGMIVKEGPRLIWQGFRHANVKLLALALDMCVPPLALLILMIITLSGLSVIFGVMTQQLFPWALAIIDLLMVGLAVIFAWFKFGRSILSFSLLSRAPIYMLVKIPLYVRFIFKRQSEWIRSKRDL
ncbi:Glycosyl transferase family 2 [Candidatus Methylobacter favarea]|uniref:Glycosyl transferase family 2 n=1 Tax=Candidatus Methylobacter favarea TaxID=2707345 RepID=A0A8S0WCH8_9GAMM|nr:glycosyltransferase family 2 protein [Candidatus Methylobacter favarea]CAA9892535.1 Glycosyl transferase family 2 [Candidatus Methylobacter favarea]